MSIASFVFSRICASSDAKRDRGLVPPDDVRVCADIAYGPAGVWNQLDMCLPEDAPAPLPTIVNVHGGGYVCGSKETYRFYCMDLAARGFAVVDFNYRLAPRFRFPAPLEDLELVLRWVAEKGCAYGARPDRVYLLGDSAGAQIASQYAAAWSNPRYARMLGLEPPRVSICGLGLSCGMYTLARSDDDAAATKLLLRDYLGRRPAAPAEALDVLAHITPAFPRTYLMSAPGDFLRAHCEPMARLLGERGVEAACRIYGDEGTGHVFNLDVRSPIARAATAEELAWLEARDRTL